jgi:hypothetical protein
MQVKTFMLRIRSFIKNRDELACINVLNAADEKFREWRAITVEEFLQAMQRDSDYCNMKDGSQSLTEILLV